MLIDVHLGLPGVAETVEGGSGIMVVKKGSFHSGIAENAGRASKVAPTAFGFRPSRVRRAPGNRRATRQAQVGQTGGSDPTSRLSLRGAPYHDRKHRSGPTLATYKPKDHGGAADGCSSGF